MPNAQEWFALYVRSNFEKTIEQCLKDKGYQAFSPFYQTLRKRSDRTKMLDLPLFPGYVFCCFECLQAPAYIDYARDGQNRRRGEYS